MSCFAILLLAGGWLTSRPAKAVDNPDFWAQHNKDGNQRNASDKSIDGQLRIRWVRNFDAMRLFSKPLAQQTEQFSQRSENFSIRNGLICLTMPPVESGVTNVFPNRAIFGMYSLSDGRLVHAAESTSYGPGGDPGARDMGIGSVSQAWGSDGVMYTMAAGDPGGGRMTSQFNPWTGEIPVGRPVQWNSQPVDASGEFNMSDANPRLFSKGGCVKTFSGASLGSFAENILSAEIDAEGYCATTLMDGNTAYALRYNGMGTATRYGTRISRYNIQENPFFVPDKTNLPWIYDNPDISYVGTLELGFRPFCMAEDGRLYYYGFKNFASNHEPDFVQGMFLTGIRSVDGIADKSIRVDFNPLDELDSHIGAFGTMTRERFLGASMSAQITSRGNSVVIFQPPQVDRNGYQLVKAHLFCFDTVTSTLRWRHDFPVGYFQTENTGLDPQFKENIQAVISGNEVFVVEPFNQNNTLQLKVERFSLVDGTRVTNTFTPLDNGQTIALSDGTYTGYISLGEVAAVDGTVTCLIHHGIQWNAAGFYNGPFHQTLVVLEGNASTPKDYAPVAVISAPITGGTLEPVFSSYKVPPTNEFSGGVPISFSSATSCDPDGGSIMAYDWSFGDGSTSTLANPVHTFAVAGVPLSAVDRTVTLRVQDNEGNWSTPVSRVLSIRNEGNIQRIVKAAVADTYVNAGSVNTNYGTSKTMTIGYVKTDMNRGYVKFDTAGVDLVNLVSAKLRLYAVRPASIHDSLRIFSTSDNWTETSINASNAPAVVDELAEQFLEGDSRLAGSLPADIYAAWIEIPVTDYVRSAGADGNVSFALEMFNSKFVISTREDGHAPQLVLKTGTASMAAPVFVTNPPASIDLNDAFTTNLSVLASSPLGENALTYHWQVMSFPAGSSVAFSDNATNSAKAVTATMTTGVSGTFVLRCVASDGYQTVVGSPINVNVILGNQSPTISQAAKATPSTVTGTTTTLSVLGADDGGESNLTYTWTTTLVPNGIQAPTFSQNGNNAAKTTVVTFKGVGAYSFKVTITDAGGKSVTSSNVAVTVNTTVVQNLGITPATSTLIVGNNVGFSLILFDQFNRRFSPTSGVAWSVSGGGTLTASTTDRVIFIAGTVPGVYTLTAVYAGNTSTATITVIDNGNAAPTISDITDKTTLQDTTTSAIPFTVDDLNNGPGALTPSATSSNTTLVTASNIVFGGSGANRTVTITPSANRTGSTTITVTVSDGALTASDTFVLTVTAPNTPPVITTQPVAQLVNVGQTASFSVVAAGSGTLTYQWTKGGTNIAGATNTFYVTPVTAIGDNGSVFAVIVTNAAGSTASSNATLTVNAFPVVSITSPLDAAKFVTPATITITANATDSDGSVSKVEFFQGSIKLGESTAAPFGMTWSNVAEGSYVLTAKATDNRGAVTTSSAINIAVNTAPSISFQPVAQTVNAGATATFSVTAAGTAPLSYQWKKDGNTISGATSSSYTTPVTVAGDNGAVFTVVVTNVAGNVTSNNAALTVNVGPSITSQPVAQIVNVGQTASFSVTATGTAPLAYQWKKNGTNISGATMASYTTPVTVAGDNGAVFTVVVSNSVTSVTSNGATLTINTGPVITSQPVAQTVNVGQTAAFSVTATGSGTLSYQWRKNGSNISGATLASYTTPATVAADDGANFSVVVTNSVGSSTSNNAALTVNVGPSITAQPVAQTVTVGQTAIFSVTATGSGTLSYQWKKNGTNISGATTASYTTPATVAGDNGASFTVVVTNLVSSVTSSGATLTVNTLPAITSQPAGQTVNVGQTATFNVTASGTSPFSYQWKKNGNNISSATSSSYTTPAAVTGDNGAIFTVVVTNVAGSVTSNGATLVVNGPPAITTQPVAQTVNVGQTATFSVVAAGSGTLTYQWTKGGVNISGATTASYTTPVTVAGDSGSIFAVVVTNGSGSTTSSNATLTVNAFPVVSISSPLNNAKFTAPATITITANASDSDGSISKVEFFEGANKLGESTASPYGVTWNNVAEGSYTLTAKATDNRGAVTTSSAINITVNTAPSITSQPAAQSVNVGQTATFSVTAAGTAPFTYQWKKNGTNISGATNNSYTTPVVVVGDSGASFTVVVTNTAGSVTSNGATLTVNVPPSITTQPVAQNVNEGATATFSVVAAGSSPLTYQWKKDGDNISGATSSSYTTPATVAGDNGAIFTVVVSNTAGNVTSNGAALAVNTVPTVTMTSPSNNSLFTIADTITIKADASVGGGTITKVEFYQGAIKLGEDAVAPYKFTWSGMSAGNYVLTAKATTNVGTTVVSSAVNIRVDLAGDLTGIGLADTKIGTANGSARILADGTWELKGMGTGVGATDNVYFQQGTQSGNFEVLVKVQSLNGGSNPLAGVMIREGTGGDERMMMVATGNGIPYQMGARIFKGGAGSITASSKSYTYPNGWVGIIREGDTVRMCKSGDGVSWVEIGKAFIPGLSKNLNVGVFISSGDSSNTATAIMSNFEVTPVTDPIQQIQYVAGGSTHSMAIRDNGNVYTWGNNPSGQLGNGTFTQSLTPKKVDGILNSVAVSGRGSHSVALTDDKMVWVWGLNNKGQLGDGTIVNRNLPQPLTGSDDSIAIVGGAAHTLVLKSDGTLQACGLNSHGQLGNGTLTNQKLLVPVTLTGVASIAGGDNFNLALKNDGTLWTWGENTSGQLGRGNLTDATTPIVTGLANGVTIAAGRNHAMAIDVNGTLWTWGNNTNGQLGLGSLTQQTLPQVVTGLSGVVAVAAGGSHTLVLKNDGTVMSSGLNDHGQLGDGSNTEQHSFVPVSSLTGVIAIAAGENFSLAMKSDGSLYAWGYNNKGQLGNGTIVESSVPVQVSIGIKVNITSPVAGDSFTAPATISITADAIDSEGSIAKVEFYQGSTLVGKSTAIPFGITWSNVAAGSYSLTAKAINSSGETLVSSPVTILVAGTSSLASVDTAQPATQSPTPVSVIAPSTTTVLRSPSVSSDTSLGVNGSFGGTPYYSGGNNFGNTSGTQSFDSSLAPNYDSGSSKGFIQPSSSGQPTSEYPTTPYYAGVDGGPKMNPLTTKSMENKQPKSSSLPLNIASAQTSSSSISSSTTPMTPKQSSGTPYGKLGGALAATFGLSVLLSESVRSVLGISDSYSIGSISSEVTGITRRLFS